MKKSKIAALALAGTLTATALLAGTYAWTSISQRAMNEVEGSVNPGGRLHDDFNGTNKDIYVENFTSNEAGTDGATIYARIRLNEYLAIGDESVVENVDYATPSDWTIFQLENENNSIFRNYFKWEWGEGETKSYLPTFNKNKDSLEADVNGTIGGIDADRITPTAYEDYVEYAADGKPFAQVADEKGIVPAEETVASRFGLEIYDLDTEDDKNEDKYLNNAIIEALHNGQGGFATHFYNITEGEEAKAIEKNAQVVLKGIDEAEQEVSVTATVTEVYFVKDADGNDTTTIEAVDLNLPRGVEFGLTDDDNNTEADVRVQIVTDEEGNIVPHEVKTTLATTKVITMAEWKAMDCPVGAYWVYDKDGWAYWADGIEPGEATGCLLTGIEKTGNIVDKYHYAIYVTAEFATAGDWGKPEDTTNDVDASGFYINTITPDGIYLLNTIAGEDKNVMINAAKTSVKPGEYIDLTSTVKLGAQTLDDSVTWSVRNVDGSALAKGTEIVKALDENEAEVARLTIGEGETAKNVWVTASIMKNSSVVSEAEIMVAIAPKLEIEVQTVDGAENLVIPENITSLALTAKVTDQWGEEYANGVTWRLADGYTDTQKTLESGELDETDSDYTKITADGVLYVGTEEKTSEIIVIATSVEDGTEKNFSVNMKTQLQYLDELSADAKENNKLGLATTTIKIDGINWYVLSRTADADDDAEEEVLLWATQAVRGWGGPTARYNWPYWSADFEFTSTALKTEMLELAGEGNTDWTKDEVKAAGNWWKYSNARAWLNYKDIDEKDVSEKLYNNGAYTGKLSETAGNKGFLADKEILSTNAASVKIKTKKEFNSDVNDEDSYLETEDQIFLLTAADLNGTGLSEQDYTTGVTAKLLQDVKETDTDGNETETNASMMTISRNLDSNTPERNLQEWLWLRSPSQTTDYISVINSNGKSGGGAFYAYTVASLRPALWMNLP